MDMSLSKLREMVKDREAWRAAVHGIAESDKEQLSWTDVRNMAVRVKAVEKVPVKSRGDGIISPSSIDPEYHGAFILFTVVFQDLSLDNIKSVQT